MFSNTSQGNGPAVFGRLWSFANCEFDDTRLELRVSGALVDLELKPLEVLLQLLVHAGEVISKERLLDSVWPGLMVVDGSLAPRCPSSGRPSETQTLPLSLRFRALATVWARRFVADR